MNSPGRPEGLLVQTEADWLLADTGGKQQSLPDDVVAPFHNGWLEQSAVCVRDGDSPLTHSARLQP